MRAVRRAGGADLALTYLLGYRAPVIGGMATVAKPRGEVVALGFATSKRGAQSSPLSNGLRWRA